MGKASQRFDIGVRSQTPTVRQKKGFHACFSRVKPMQCFPSKSHALVCDPSGCQSPWNHPCRNRGFPGFENVELLLLSAKLGAAEEASFSGRCPEIMSEGSRLQMGCSGEEIPQDDEFFPIDGTGWSSGYALDMGIPDPGDCSSDSVDNGGN
jgi:hypothetical protein